MAIDPLLALGGLWLLTQGKRSAPQRPTDGRSADQKPTDGRSADQKLRDTIDAAVDVAAPIVSTLLGGAGGAGAGAAGGAGAGAAGGAGGAGTTGGAVNSALIGKTAVTKATVDVSWGIPATVAGVSTGFLVVAGLWAVALVAGIVFSALLAPEMARRGTMGRLYGGERGSYAWRAGRMYWAQLVHAQRPGWRVGMLRWPDIDTAWGATNVIGFLPIIVRTGEDTPPNSETMSPDDIYGVYDWAAKRELTSELVKTITSEAHEIALVWTYGMLCAVRACGVAIGEVKNRQPPVVDNFYTRESVGLFSDLGTEFNGSKPLLENQRAAWLQGIRDGLQFVRGNAWGVGGQYLLSPNDAQLVASLLVDWQLNFTAPPSQPGKQARFTASGRILEIKNDAGDVVSMEIKVVP